MKKINWESFVPANKVKEKKTKDLSQCQKTDKEEEKEAGERKDASKRKKIPCRKAD